MAFYFSSNSNWGHARQPLLNGRHPGEKAVLSIQGGSELRKCATEKAAINIDDVA